MRVPHTWCHATTKRPLEGRFIRGSIPAFAGMN